MVGEDGVDIQNCSKDSIEIEPNRDNGKAEDKIFVFIYKWITLCWLRKFPKRGKKITIWRNKSGQKISCLKFCKSQLIWKMMYNC